MVDIKTNLAPFWHEIEESESGEPVRLKLRPLTQPQVIELFATFEKAGEGSRPSEMTWYRAGCMGLDGAGQIENLTIDGEPARWPKHKQLIPFRFIVSAGIKLCLDAWGGDSTETDQNL
jgi:hypothetical protein